MIPASNGMSESELWQQFFELGLVVDVYDQWLGISSISTLNDAGQLLFNYRYPGFLKHHEYMEGVHEGVSLGEVFFDFDLTFDEDQRYDFVKWFYENYLIFAEYIDTMFKDWAFASRIPVTIT